MQRKKNDNKHSLSLIINAAIFAIFVITVFIILGVVHADYLRKIDMLSIFLPTKEYFNQCMTTPGGLMAWISTYLTQYFYYPLLGASIYTILLALISVTSVYAFRLSKSLWLSSLVVPSLIVISLINIGYIISSHRGMAFVYNMPLGTLIAILIFWAYRLIKKSWVKPIAVLLAIFAGYSILGAYGLLAGILCCAYDAINSFKKGYQKVLWSDGLCALLAITAVRLIPKFWFHVIGGDLPMSQIYTVQLPVFHVDEGSMWIPFTVGASILVVMAISSVRHIQDKDKRYLPIFGYLIGAGSIVLVILGRNSDPNLRLTLSLDNAVWQQDWQTALDIAEAHQNIDPTRVNVMYTDIALLRSGQAADKIFTYRIASVPYDTKRNLRATHDIISRMISLHTGQINYAYRWAMEYEVEYGLSVEQLKFMVKAALLNGDHSVARKCLDNLSLTKFHKQWAEDYYKFIDDPILIESDPELSQIFQLKETDGEYIIDRHQLEGYIWDHLSNLKEGTFEQLELSLLANLITQNIHQFAQNIGQYANMVERLPRHFQEAILVWSTIDETFDRSKFKIDKTVLDRFNQYMNAESMYSRMKDEDRAKMLEPAFGDTFMYYYLYNTNQTII